MDKELKRYIRARDEMLLKGSVEELKKFALENKKHYSPMFIQMLDKASYATLEITLHKMIANCSTLPEDYRKESADWLLERGIGGVI
jgi:hypothetical protein